MSTRDIKSLKEQYNIGGFALVDNILDRGQPEQFKAHLYSIISSAYRVGQRIAAFDKVTGDHDRDPLFLDSGSSATVFHEPVALGWTGRVPEELYSEAVARVGHGLHVIDGAVRDWLGNSEVGQLSRATGRVRPAVIETMYVRKSRFSEPLPPHLDHSYLWTDPPSVQVLWIALDAANESNGGLLISTTGISPASSKRLVRTGNEATMIQVEGVNRSVDEANLADLTLIRRNPGDAVLVDGLLLHGSGDSQSGISRDALAIHIVDLSCRWSDRNYLGRMQPLEL